MFLLDVRGSGDPAAGSDGMRAAVTPNPLIQQGLRQAQAMHQAGRLADAARLYRSVLGMDGRHATAHHLLGVVLLQSQKPEDALPHLREAARLNPQDVAILGTLGAAQVELGRFDDALATLRQAIRLQPNRLDSHFNLGVALRGLGRGAEAADAYRHGLALQPRDAEAHYALGVIQAEIGRLDDAAASFRRAIEIRRDYPEAEANLARALRDLSQGDPEAVSRGARAQGMQEATRSLAEIQDELRHEPQSPALNRKLGLAFAALGRMGDAVVALKKAAAVAPQDAAIHVDLAGVLVELRRYKEAEAAAAKALALDPDRVEAHLHLGAALQGQDRLEDAAGQFLTASESAPDRPEVHVALAGALTELGLVEEAMQACDKALAIDPGLAAARYRRGRLLLATGAHAAGFADLEYRFAADPAGCRRAAVAAPVWTGEPLEGHSILVHTEQTPSDAIQFARFVPALAETGAKVTLLVAPELKRLLGPLATHAVVTDTAEGRSFDWQVALNSLPLRLGLAEPELLPLPPYLTPDPARVAHWRERIRADGFRVGLAWQGRETAPGGRARAIPLAAFAPLATVPGVRLISLQKRPGAEIRTAGPAMRLETLGAEFDSAPDPYVDVAAAIDTLDLVVTADTEVAHIAGAMGKPVWLALDRVPDWRWGLSDVTSPWYPTMGIVRQQATGDWDTVFAGMARALAREVAERG
jgi:tetratricopeptide (TPR) repeat protein